MTNKNVLRRFHHFKSNELERMREYLEQMAEKGWFLTKITGAFQIFEKRTPQKLRYAVEIFDAATVYDTRPEVEAEDYIELCRQAGWNFCGCFGRVYVFCSDAEENLLPIETDLEQKYRVIRGDLLKDWAGQYLAGLLPMLLLEVFVYFQGHEFFFSAPVNLFFIALLLFQLGECIVNLLGIWRWCSAARRELKTGQLKLRGNGSECSLTFRSAVSVAKLAALFAVIGLFAFFSGASSLWVSLATAVLVSAILLWTSGRGWSRDSNKTVSVVLGIVIALSGIVCTGFLSDRDEKQIFLPADQVDVSEFPLSLDDLEEDAGAYRWAKADREKTFLAEYTYYREYAKETPEDKYATALLVYSVYQSPFPRLLEDYLEYRMKDAVPERTEQLAAADYGAAEAWKFSNGLLLSYPDKVVWIWPLAKEFDQPQALREAFNG